MCLANPALIIETDGQTALIEMDGVRRTAVVSFIEDPKPGEYVLLHAGFAIRKWTEADVREYRALMDEIATAGADSPPRTP